MAAIGIIVVGVLFLLIGAVIFGFLRNNRKSNEIAPSAESKARMEGRAGRTGGHN